MKNTNVQEKLLSALLEIKQNNFSICGLCHEVFMIDQSLSVSAELKSIFKLWPKFSGFAKFPVPSSSNIEGPYWAFMDTEDMWVDDYGKNRIDLLDFALTYLGMELWKTYSLKADC